MVSQHVALSSALNGFLCTSCNVSWNHCIIVPCQSFTMLQPCSALDCVWNVMAHAPKPELVFRRNGRVQLNRQGRQFSRLLAAEVCASAVVMLDTPWSEVVWRVLATHSIRQFPLHFPTRASPCAITFQLESTMHYDFKHITLSLTSTWDRLEIRTPKPVNRTDLEIFE